MFPSRRFLEFLLDASETNVFAVHFAEVTRRLFWYFYTPSTHSGEPPHTLMLAIAPCIVDSCLLQMAAVVQWHRETVGMASLYEIPHQMTQTPKNDPANTPFRVSDTP